MKNVVAIQIATAVRSDRPSRGRAAAMTPPIQQGSHISIHGIQQAPMVVRTNVGHIGDAGKSDCSPTLVPNNVAPPDLGIFQEILKQSILE